MKAKRLVALLMAVIIVVGLVAVTASAYTCAYCGTSNNNLVYEGSIETYATTRVEGCGYKGGTHVHYYQRTPSTSSAMIAIGNL